MLIHADADAFFASVEERDDPRLRGRPFVVGEQVVACPSYLARRMGVPSGWSTHAVRRRWPEVVVVPLRGEAYTEASRALFRIFRAVTPLVEPGSVEEAFLDVGAVAADAEGTARIAAQLRSRCREEVGLPVSAGVGRTKLMAKLASRRAKPDGLVVIAPEAEPGVRAALALDEIWGVGERTRERLLAAGLTSLPRIAEVPEAELCALLGTGMGRSVAAMAHGRESSQVRLPTPPGAVSRSRTISPPTRTRSRIEGVVDACVTAIEGRVREERRAVTRVSVTLGLDDGADLIQRASATTGEVRAVVGRLLAATGYEEDGRGVAQVTIGVQLAPTG